MSRDELLPPTYHELNKERFKERKKAWAQANKEKIKESNKKWREKNREYLKEKQKEYNKSGYYKSKLLQKFNVMKDEIQINDSEQLLEDFSNLLDEMFKYELLDEEEYNNLKNLINKSLWI
jgi:hypothetical protein